MKVNEGYESLAGVLQRALDQAQNGKGAERHANALPFDKQPMQTIAAQVGVGFLTGQAIKKTQEGQTLPAGRDVAELLGAINYLAGAVIFLESRPVPLPTDAKVCDQCRTWRGHSADCPANYNHPGCGIVGGCDTPAVCQSLRLCKGCNNG